MTPYIAMHLLTRIAQSELLADAALSKFRTELQSHQVWAILAMRKTSSGIGRGRGTYLQLCVHFVQDVKFTSLQRELETLKTDLDKVKSEIRYVRLGYRRS